MLVYFSRFWSVKGRLLWRIHRGCCDDCTDGLLVGKQLRLLVGLLGTLEAGRWLWREF